MHLPQILRDVVITVQKLQLIKMVKCNFQRYLPFAIFPTSTSIGTLNKRSPSHFTITIDV